jgi:hypothetical protein
MYQQTVHNQKAYAGERQQRVTHFTHITPFGLGRQVAHLSADDATVFRFKLTAKHAAE